MANNWLSIFLQSYEKSSTKQRNSFLFCRDGVSSAKSEIRKKLHNCLLFNKNLLTGLRNTEKEGLAAQVCQSLFILYYSLRSESDWAMAHTTGSSQCRQGCCEDAHNHLNDGLPSSFLHNYRFNLILDFRI